MPSLADLTRTFAAEDLDPALAKQLEPLFRYLNANFGAIKDAIGGGLLGIADNLFCEIVTAGFTHNTAQYIGLRKLQTAAAALVLRADGQAVVAAPEVVMSGDRKAKVTLRFNDPTATNVSVVLLILTEGNGARATAAVWADPILKSLLTTTGDLIYASAPNAPARLAAGALNTVLTSGGPGVAPAWAAASAVSSLPPGAALWVHPTSADAFDDEFESTLSGSWTAFNATVSGSAIDPYAAFATAGTSRVSCNSFRPGWLMIQPTTNASLCGYYKSVTLNTNDIFYCRFSRNAIMGNTTQLNTAVSLLLADGTGLTNYLHIHMNREAATTPLIAFNTQAGGVANFPLQANSELSAAEYLLLHKVGTTYYAYVSTGSSGWCPVGSTTHATNFSLLMLLCSNSGVAGFGNPIMGFDFIRRIPSTATALP